MASASASTAADTKPANGDKSGMGNHGLAGKVVQVPVHSLLVTIKHQVGALDDVLAVVRKFGLNLTKIESRPSKALQDAFDIFMDFGEPSENLPKASEEIKKLAVTATLLSPLGEFVWFPRKPTDFDEVSKRVVSYGDELAPNHPGYHDEEYRRRRKELGLISLNYRHGHEIPRIKYTESEIATWRVIFKNLQKLYPTHACKQFNKVFPLLEKHCGFNENNIPQLQEVSQFLKECTGWTLRPVAGLLSTRDFLNAFAFRIFHSTQYIRHHSVPMYTPEPDVCHELLGHVPLFADPDFADFAQQIGIASLGATDEQIALLGTCYWFTAEFGLCKENGKLKAYGAGLLSSYGELEYCLSDKPKVEPFEPFKTAIQPYDITQYQPLYYFTESFEDANEKLRAFAESMPRPFVLNYNPYTETIEVVDSRDKLVKHAQRLQYDMNLLIKAMKKVD